MVWERCMFGNPKPRNLSLEPLRKRPGRGLANLEEGSRQGHVFGV